MSGFVTGGLIGVAAAALLAMPRLEPGARKKIEQTGESIQQTATGLWNMAHRRFQRKRRRRWF